jgi:hypothetical protein
MALATSSKLRAALAAYVRETFGVAITQYRDEWLKAPDNDSRFTFEGLDFVHLYESLEGSADG